MVANWIVAFFGSLFTPTRTKVFATNKWQYCGAKITETQECMKHSGIKFDIRKNIGANTDD